MNASTDDPIRTVPGVPTRYAAEVIEELDDRLTTLIDLELTLKHIHWNVTGPNFISVHEMLDDFVAKVRPMVDAVAERIRTMGGEPIGTPGAVAESRNWNDYPLGQGPTHEHLRLLDDVFDHVISQHRHSLSKIAKHDPITEDLLIAQTGDLELLQWFVRSFLHGSQPDADAPRFGVADREPTADEERAAASAAGIDDTTRQNYREMTKVGATVKGEGRID